MNTRPRGRNKGWAFDYKGLSPRLAGKIVEERESWGPFLSVDEFVKRIRMPGRTVEALLQAGALEGLTEEKEHGQEAALPCPY